ncbi:hypothetical protein ACFVMC_26635 [Nocardia sp. NPDC127579]|uniref:hypothetical protein n=1 Tax=Nocardia sp. NPDC127579 TaxID=3345402 RepID=UPI0036273A9D
MTISDHPMCSCGCGGSGNYSRGMCRTSYERFRRREIAYGRWQPRVAADDARAHIERLRAAGMCAGQLAELAGVAETTIVNAAQPNTQRVTAEVERAILAVPIPERVADVVADNALVPAIGAQRRIQALVTNGYPIAHLARELQIWPGSSVMSALTGRPNTASGGTGESIGAAKERAVKALFDRLQMVPGPSDRARAFGRRNGWPLPFEWDEDSIDDPAARPVRSRWSAASARAERREQVRELSASGAPAWQIAEQLGITARSVVRQRSTVGAPQRPEQDWGLER